ncbi:uncharacterized protein RB166_018892 [Leptodactylus fuscus]|uniref:uncharacterized protein LOC142183609 n=1 Tax=Leptodactylus fuscus TaxID=238119 RepID=UPI003F4EE7C8
MVKKNSIPERWRHLKAVGQRVPGSRFIAFKVPLKGVTNQRVTQNQKFTPKDLIAAIRSQNEELGLIIDLTNTERYYTTKDLPKSVQYVKLHTAGLKIPDDATIHQFKRVVYKFLAANSDSDKLIGVHCTTGINRTGYLICRYLIDVDLWRPLHALSAFAQARGHPIEGTVYIEDIVKGPSRSNVGIDLPPTLEEKRAWDTGTYYAPENLSRERGVKDETIKPLLELIPGHEHADFDARDRRPLPLMRSRSDDYQDDGRDYFNPRSEFRGRGLPLGDMNDDLDFRGRDLPSSMSERFRRRAVDFNPEGRFNPEMENRRSFHGSDPRHLMDPRDNYGPRDGQRLRGMPQEQMGYDDRMRGQQSPVQGYSDYNEPPYRGPSYPPGKMNSAQYDDNEPERRIRPLSSDLDFRERLRRQEFQGMESEDQRFDPREREMMADSFKGPFNERMRPRNARTLEGPMNSRMNARSMQPLVEPGNDMMNPRNARSLEGPMNSRMNVRNTQALGEAVNDMMNPRNARALEGPMNSRMNARGIQPLGEAVNDMMNPRDRRVMEGPMHDRMNPRDGRFMEGSAQERFSQRDPQSMRNTMDERPMGGPAERMPPSREAQLMEGSMNNRMYARDPRQMEASASERMPTRVARLMDLPLNDRANPREAQGMENSMNDRIPPRDSRALNRPVNEMMTTRDARSMEGPLNSRMHSRVDRAMEGSMNDQMHSREGAAYERVPLRDTRAIEGLMNEIMYQRDVRTRQESMNEPMHPRDPRAMEGSMNERMYSHDSEFPVSKQREFMNDSRPFEGRKINPSEESLRGANRFAPYPSLMKPGQPAEMARGLPRNDIRDPRDMLPPSQDAGRFPPRSRFN